MWRERGGRCCGESREEGDRIGGRKESRGLEYRYGATITVRRCWLAYRTARCSTLQHTNSNITATLDPCLAMCDAMQANPRWPLRLVGDPATLATLFKGGRGGTVLERV